MAPVTAEQVRQARAEGVAAGRALQGPRPNPYSPRHVPEWRGPRTARERAQRERDARGPRILARVWLRGWRDGIAAYARDRGLASPSALD